jgi:hypothetical protein
MRRRLCGRLGNDSACPDSTEAALTVPAMPYHG